MIDTFGLIACSKGKQGEDNPDREFRAEDLYDTWLFDGRARAAKANCEAWAIFSAKHGYVDPDDRLTWYDKRITELTPEERRELAAEVVEELPETDCLMILMGRDYAEPLKVVLPDRIEVWDPLEGVRLFDQRGELRDLATSTEQMTLADGSGQYSTGTEQCFHPECDRRATAVYEGTVPPADVIRRKACWIHGAKATPVRYLDTDTDREGGRSA